MGWKLPEYLYACKWCDIRLVITRSIEDSEQVPGCPHCTQALNRVYDFGNVQFKGEGFYSTDKGKG